MHLAMRVIALLFFTVGIPLSGDGIDISLWAEQIALVECSGNETRISSCNVTTITSTAMHQQARVRCFDLEGEYIICNV